MKVGIIGAGQLARMLAIASKPLDIHCHCQGARNDDPAHNVAELSVIDASDHAAMMCFAESVDVLTLENENVDLSLAKALNTVTPLRPGVRALEMSQDRLAEKKGFKSLGIPVAPFKDVSSLSALVSSVEELGIPCIVKTRRFGYDGKGQFVIKTQEDIENAWSTLGKHRLIVEGFVNFDTEVSIVAARGLNGEVAFYPLTENIHRHGILRVSKAPFVHPVLQQSAEAMAIKLLTHLEYVGVLAIEFFVCGDQLIVNEFAPRVHNSGHWTIEGAKTSQFENHMRAVCGSPLGSTALKIPSMMINCIGKMPDRDAVRAYPNAHYHDYHKAPRAGRKLGHVTVCDEEGFVQYQALVDGLGA